MKLTKYHSGSSAFEAFCNFNTKVYMAFENVLRAAYLKKVEIHLQKLEEGKTKVTEHYNVAGLGMQETEMGDMGFYVGKKIYLDIQSFKHGNNGFSCAQRYPITNNNGVPCASIFWWNKCLSVMFNNEAQFDIWDKCFSIYRWKWNGIEAEKVNVECTTITLTEDGWTTDAIFPENSYPTKEECEQSNQISVIEFE